MKKKYTNLLVFLVLCIEIMVGAYVFFYVVRKGVHAKTPLQQIASRSEGEYTLPQDVLQSLLALKEEEKQDLVAISIKEVQKRVEACPAILRANIRTLAPDTLVVEYALREPLFILSDYPTIAIDASKHTFPLEPYFSNLHLPLLTLFNMEFYPLCVEIERTFASLSLQIDEIDASDIDALGLFRREIRLKLQSKNRMVRLPVDTLSISLKRFAWIMQQYPDYKGTIDLRFPNVGYLEQYFVPKKISEEASGSDDKKGEKAS